MAANRFGVRPWDWSRLTLGDAAQVVAGCREIEEEAKRADREGG